MSQPRLLVGEVVEPPDKDVLNMELDRLEAKIVTARAELKQLELMQQVAAAKMRALYIALHGFYGEEPSIGAPGPSQNAGGPLNAERYQPWKNKFPGQTASAIDLLVRYEAGLTRKQLAGFLGVESGSGTMSQIIFKLNKAELIDKDGNLIRLKRL